MSIDFLMFCAFVVPSTLQFFGVWCQQKRDFFQSISIYIYRQIGVALEFQKVLDTHVELDTWKVGGGLLAFSQQRCFEVVLSSGELCI